MCSFPLPVRRAKSCRQRLAARLLLCSGEIWFAHQWLRTRPCASPRIVLLRIGTVAGTLGLGTRGCPGGPLMPALYLAIKTLQRIRCGYLRPRAKYHLIVATFGIRSQHWGEAVDRLIRIPTLRLGAINSRPGTTFSRIQPSAWGYFLTSRISVDHANGFVVVTGRSLQPGRVGIGLKNSIPPFSAVESPSCPVPVNTGLLDQPVAAYQ